MSRLTLLMFVLVLIGIAGGVAWYLIDSQRSARVPASPVATSTVETRTGQAIYTNGEVGFSVVYPETVLVEDTFSSTYHLPSSWRVSASASGTPVASFIGYSTASDHAYPRYFVAMVRIGVSEDKKEVASCTKASSTTGEKALPDVIINGTTWHAFSMESAGMMQYLKGISYRVIHEGKCVAVEKIQTGSSYRDDPKSDEDIADAVLQKQYDSLDSVIQSFAFARP